MSTKAKVKRRACFKTNERGEGFHITFANGNTISVQWREGNYANRDGSVAEVAAWDSAGRMIKLDFDREIYGWASPDVVADLIAKVSA